MPTGDYQNYLVNAALCANVYSYPADPENVKELVNTYTLLFPETPDPEPQNPIDVQKYADKYRSLINSLLKSYGFTDDFRTTYDYSDLVSYDALSSLHQFRKGVSMAYSSSDCLARMTELVAAAINKEQNP